MTLIRRGLRASVAAWLVCQLVAISTIAARACCAADNSPSTKCHSEAPAPSCPMRGDNGAACPMHRGAPVETECALRGTCAGPQLLTATLFAAPAVPVPMASILQDATQRGAEPLTGERPFPASVLPETPPPRA
jgi:hypothetical protein